MAQKILALMLLTFIVHATFADPVGSKKKNRCSNLSCVHASATIIQKLNTEVAPCDDFYEYACGAFLEEQHTPDEKTNVDTLALMDDKLTEYLLTLLTKPVDEDDKKLHKLAKALYNKCNDNDSANQLSKDVVLKLINEIGHWPMLEGKNWNKSKFKIRDTILNFHRIISNSSVDIFKSGRNDNADWDKNKKFAPDVNDPSKVSRSLKALINSIVESLNVENSTELTKDIDDLIEFETKLDVNFRKFKTYRQQHKNKTKGYKENKNLKAFHKYVTYVNFLSPFVLAGSSDITEDLPLGFQDEYWRFIDKTPLRTKANFFFWRIIQSSLPFSGRDWRSIVLNFEKEAFDKEDIEQRWIFCSKIVADVAPVATGSLYVSQYFNAEDKKSAELLVTNILTEYIETIKSSTWMDDSTKQQALNITSLMTQYIGYHEKLVEPETETFYDQLPSLDQLNFFESGLAFVIFNADREYRRSYFEHEFDESDWTKYSIPATVNAFYNSKDNSIQFPAAILQTPNFDKDRPNSLNFGAIGSVIGHEITHAFDDLASQYGNWSEKSIEEYETKVKCIVDQYSDFRVNEVEEYLAENEEIFEEFKLRGNLTKKEDIADNGGVKLSYFAYQKFAIENPASNIVPTGLQNFTTNELFFISYAQTFCSVARPKLMKSKVENDNHSLDKFRIFGTLSNMKEFAEVFNCPTGSRMNPEKKCAVW